ncbi:MAG: hypothetical protein ACU85V_20430 [Gammaproteobacteria bacterium]
MQDDQWQQGTDRRGYPDPHFIRWREFTVAVSTVRGVNRYAAWRGARALGVFRSEAAARRRCEKVAAEEA